MYNRTINFLLGMALVGVSPVAQAEVKPSGAFGDNMVLQRHMEVPIWGSADKGEEVTVAMNDVRVKAVADKNGEWKVKLPKQEAGGPYTVVITGKSNTVTFQNVLFGEVWFASGQSNMMYKMERGVPNGDEEIAAADYEDIRLFNHPKTMQQHPAKAVGGGSWEVCSPESVKPFSAVAYFFARELHKRYRVPIGIILSGWGGTQAEAFCSYDVLKSIDEYKEEASKLESGEIDWFSDFEPNNVRRQRNRDLMANSNRAIELGVLAAEYDARSWENVNLNDWDKSTTNITWIRNDFEISVVDLRKETLLTLGKPHTRADVYLNGQLLTRSMGKAIEVKIPANTLREGRNNLSIRIADNQLKPGFEPHGNARLSDSHGNTVVDLSGHWKYNDQLEPTIKPYVQHASVLGSMFGGMINPFIGYGIRGVIWYQGEANSRNPQLYHEVFSKMITDWRLKWGQGDFPFLYVQLPNYIDQRAQKGIFSSWPLLREAQLKTLTVPNTGMAITVDVGDPHDLHPKNKYPVGLRLSRVARKIAYGEDIVHTGPMVKKVETDGSKGIVHFENVGDGLVLKRDNGLSGFEVAGRDKKFHRAQAVVVGNQVVVSSNQVNNIVAIRYNWRDNPTAHLYNFEDLPATPFRTDVWNDVAERSVKRGKSN